MAVFTPNTGNLDLNLALEQLANNVNAVIGNGGNTISVGDNNAIIAPDGEILGYLFQYMWATFSTDGSGTGASPTTSGKSYYGIFNTTDGSTVPPTFQNYTYTRNPDLNGNTLYYKTTGARNIQWDVNAQPISNEWKPVNLNGTYTAIDLDFVTASSSNGANGVSTYAATLYQANNSSTPPTTPVGGTYYFSNNFFDTSTLSPNTWTRTLPAGNTSNVWATQYTFSTINPNEGVLATSWGPANVVFKVGTNGNASYTGTVYQAGSSAPSTPTTSGYYNFATNTLTPPSGGWTANIPSAPSTNIYATSATFSSNNSAGNVANTTSWAPAVLTFTSGGQGPRGSIPLAYILCDSDPRQYIGTGGNSSNDTFFTQQFSSSRFNTTAPIGIGQNPITNDAAQFFFANTANTANNGSVFLSYNSAGTPNSTVWANVYAQVIDGNLLVSGTVTANAINTNSTYTLKLKGGNVVLGTGGNVINSTGTGFYFEGSPSSSFAGDAFISGNVRIGSNLRVDGLITSGNLNSNTVKTTTLVPQAVTTQYGISTNVLTTFGPTANVTATLSGTTLTLNTGTTSGLQLGYFAYFASNGESFNQVFEILNSTQVSLTFAQAPFTNQLIYFAPDLLLAGAQSTTTYVILDPYAKVSNIPYVSGDVLQISASFTYLPQYYVTSAYQTQFLTEAVLLIKDSSAANTVGNYAILATQNFTGSFTGYYPQSSGTLTQTQGVNFSSFGYTPNVASGTYDVTIGLNNRVIGSPPTPILSQAFSVNSISITINRVKR